MLIFGWALKSDAYLSFCFWQKWTGNPSWSFLFWLCQKCLRSSFFCSVSVLLILLPFTISAITKQNLHSDVLDLRSIFYVFGLAVAENINVFKIMLCSQRQGHKLCLCYTIPKEEFNLVISDITPKFTLSHLSVNIEHYTGNCFVFLIISLFLCAYTGSDDAGRWGLVVCTFQVLPACSWIYAFSKGFDLLLA